MLHVDEQPVVVGRRREHAGRAGAQVVHPEAERQLVVLQLLLCLVLEHDRPPDWPLCLGCLPLPVKHGARSVCMIFSENRPPLFGIMQCGIACSAWRGSAVVSRHARDAREDPMQNSEKIWQLVDTRKEAYEALSDRVWGMPEIAYTEYRSM